MKTTLSLIALAAAAVVVTALWVTPPVWLIWNHLAPQFNAPVLSMFDTFLLVLLCSALCKSTK